MIMEDDNYSSDDDDSSVEYSFADAFETEDASDDEFSDDYYREASEESYNPDGVDSDDDANGCCHWSKTEDGRQEALLPDENIPEYGKPSCDLEDGTKPHMIIEKIMDDAFIHMCIDSTNEHGSSDPNFIANIGRIPSDDKGICFLRGFIAIKWHLRLLRYPQLKWAWSEDPLRCQTEIKKVMPLRVFSLLLKHFCVVKQSVLPPKESPNYHPLQNINAGVE